MCLRKGDMANKSKASYLKYKICAGNHRDIFCRQQPTIEEKGVAAVVLHTSLKRSGDHPTVLLQTAPVILVGAKRQVSARAILDGGSYQTFVQRDIVKQLKLSVISEEVVKISTFGSIDSVIL